MLVMAILKHFTPTKAKLWSLSQRRYHLMFTVLYMHSEVKG